MATTEEPPYLFLRTIRRRTRLPSEIHISFARRNGRYYVIAEHGEQAQWVRNLLVNQEVQWRVVGAAAESEPSEPVQALSREKYSWGVASLSS